MARSIQMKLVLILILLIVSLMAVAGSFLINNVVTSYLDDFSMRISNAFSKNIEFVSALRDAASGANPPEDMRNVLRAYSGNLGMDPGYRDYYILDGKTGRYLSGSNEYTATELTPNIVSAMTTGEPAYARSLIGSYIDAAIPIKGNSGTYIVYIRDNRENLNSLTGNIFTIILESLALGILISVSLGFILSKTMTSPIEQLTLGTRELAAGNFSKKLPVYSNDEIGVLTHTFNDMAKVLKDTLDEIAGERNKLSTLFLHMNDGVVAFSRDGAMMHKNPAACRMLNIAEDENPDYTRLFSPLAPLSDVLRLKSPDYLEFNYSLGDRSFLIFIVPFGETDGEGGIMAVMRDVTEQINTERTRREFIANVSHELRTPITNIKSYAETLVDDDVPPELAKSFLKVILNESDRMTRIVRDLLTLSRLDYGKMEWTVAPFSPSRSLRNVVDAMRLEARSRNQELIFDESLSLPELTGDRERIEQVFMNILANAIKYTPDGGRIEVTAVRGEDGLEFIFKDNGEGIPEADLPHIFDRFYRVDKARSRESGGTGLGLSIARDIIKSHGGDIFVESRYGGGTTMTVFLPFDNPLAGGNSPARENGGAT